MHEFGYIYAEHRDFAHQGRGDEGELLLRRQEYGFNTIRYMSRHGRQLKLEFEVRHCAQSADDDRDAIAARKVDRETGVPLHLNVGNILEHLPREMDALLEGEHRRLV